MPRPDWSGSCQFRKLRVLVAQNKKRSQATLWCDPHRPHRQLSGLDPMKNGSIVHDHEAAIKAIIELFACD